MTLADTFQVPPLCALVVNSVPGSTQWCFLRSTDGPLKPTEDHFSIDTGFLEPTEGLDLSRKRALQAST